VGGLCTPEFQIEPYKFTLALAQAAEKLGVEIRHGEVVGFGTQEDRVTSVRLASGHELDAAIALDSSYEIAHKRRGEVLAAMGKLGAALKALGEAQRLAPDNSNIRDSLERVKQLRANSDAADSPNTGRPRRRDQLDSRAD
jgi:flavin-dependent dehydrogenase